MIDKMVNKTVISQQIVHDALMIRKYKGQMKDKSLVIQNDPALLSIEFSDELDLQSLVVSGSQNLNLERVPKNLRHLVINNCNIKSTKGLAPAKLLTSLDLSNNLLNDLTELDVLTSLQKLDISFNALQNIDNVGKLTNLVSLNVKRNNLKIVKPIETLKLLEELDITENSLQDLQYVKQLPKLKWEAIVKENRIGEVEVKKQTEEAKAQVGEKGDGIEMNEEQKISLQIVYDAKQIDRLKGQVANGSLEISSDANITSFGFVDHWKLTSLKIVDCPNLSLERSPKLLTSLTINKCGLQSTKGIENAKLLTHLSLSKNSLTDLEDLDKLTALEALDLSFNQLYQIDQVSALIKLKSLNLRRNNLIVVKPVETLKELKFIDINENLIQDLQYVKQLPKLTWDMIVEQNEPALLDYQKHLGEGKTEQDAKNFASSIVNDKIKSKQILYDSRMISKFKDFVKDSQLEINSDSSLTSFGFVDQFKLNSLKNTNCLNLTLERAPNFLKHLTINHCELQSTDGIENAALLTSLNLSNNQLSDLKYLDKLTLLQNLDISSNILCDITNISKLASLEQLNLQNNKLIICKPLQALKLLQSLQIGGNMLQDLIHVKNLVKFSWDMISEQNQPIISDYRNYYINVNNIECSEAQINTFINDLTENIATSQQITHDALMIKQYQPQAQNNNLIIENDQKLLSFNFTDHINVNKLTILNCYNLDLKRSPQNVTVLTINSCNLSSLNGIQNMKQLTELNLSMNQLQNISEIQYLVNLRILDIGQNNIEQINAISKLNQLVELDISQNLIDDVSAVAQLKLIKILDISYNKIDNIDELQCLNQLVRLNASKNNIASINCLKNMINLVYLNISFNKIISLEICKELPKLQDLRLESNLIQNFEPVAQLQNANKYWITNQLTPTDEDYMRSYNCTLPAVKNFISQNINEPSQNKLMLFNKYKDSVTNDNKLQINNEKGLNTIQFTDILKVTDLEAINCKTITFDDYPKLLLRLKLNNCILKSDETQQYITNIYQLSQLTDIDLSSNRILDIAELAALTKLKSVNLQNNIINRVNALKDLNLTYLNLHMNKIVFMQPIVHFQSLNNNLILTDNFICDNFELQNQRNPLQEHFKNVLGPNSTEQQAIELMNFISYNNNMRSKYNNLVNNNSLSITNDESLFDIQFINYFNIQTLFLNNCKNVQLIRKCVQLQIDQSGFVRDNLDVKLIQQLTKLTVLKVNNCGLTHLTGIDQMNNLKELNVKNNKIVSIKELKQLQLIKIELEHNIIYDMKILTEMKNYNTDWVQEQDEATDQDYTNYLVQTNQQIDLDKFKLGIKEQKKESKELIEKFGRRYEKDMIMKYQKDLVNNSLRVQNDDQLINLNFADDLDVTNLIVENCKNVKFVKVPVKVTSLTVNNCNITNVAGIEAMNQLTYIDLKNNAIVLIEQLQKLSNLKQVLVDNNYIQDLEHLINTVWISLQQEATDSILQQYLTDTNSALTVDAFKTQLAPKKAKSDQLFIQLQPKFDNDLHNKYQPVTKFQTLYVENDSAIKDLKFVEKLDLVEVILKQCTNVKFTRTPNNLLYLSLQDCNISDLSGLQYFTQLKKLQITNSPLRSLSHISALVNLLSLQITGSKLTNVVGIGNLKQLQYLDLSENAIISIQPLSQLLQSKQFKQLYLDDNFIVDQEWLVPNYSEWICRQRVPVDSDYQNYIQDTNLNINIVQLKSSFTPLITKSNQLIQDYVVKYESEMKAKYQSKIYKYGNNTRIDFNKDDLVRDLKFVEDLGVTELCIQNCPNVRKMPLNLRCLQFYDSNLKTVKCVERATNLEQLYLYIGNQIVNANGLRALNILKYLDLRNNKVMDLSAVDYLKAKGCNCYTDYQTQPSQQEIDESRLW
ncbi:Conserved_hypothetical protein [Hexamita inflata]|uniref:Uncharacterized protein n=1 Tax=Hexamita inflata TaxID=28002 RepID=A0AA86RPQ0_9EUKA|nr:Conserved hypothetical protein [Hexamita inflata]